MDEFGRFGRACCKRKLQLRITRAWAVCVRIPGRLRVETGRHELLHTSPRLVDLPKTSMAFCAAWREKAIMVGRDSFLERSTAYLGRLWAFESRSGAQMSSHSCLDCSALCIVSCLHCDAKHAFCHLLCCLHCRFKRHAPAEAMTCRHRQSRCRQLVA